MLKSIKLVLTTAFVGMLLSVQSSIAQNADILSPEEAYKYSIADSGGVISLDWHVEEGYYLYRGKMSYLSNTDSVVFGNIDLPEGLHHEDEFFGVQPVYRDRFQVLIPYTVTGEAPASIDLTIRSQGCADIGLCYPPQRWKETINLVAAVGTSSGDSGASALNVVTDNIVAQTTTAAAQAPGSTARFAAPPVSEQARLASLISGSSMLLVIATFFGAGLLLALTPCVLPMVPILSGIIAGEGDDISAMKGFSLALTYVMGMAVVYTGAGIAAAAVGIQLQAVFNQPWVLAVFSGLFVILAMSMFGLFTLQMPSSVQSKLSAISGNQKGGTYIGTFVMGALSSLIVTACVAPPLVATLTVISQTGDMLRGGSALFALSMGMGAPLLLVGASAGKLIPKAGPWMDAVKNAFGFMMLGLAIWMMSRVLPGEVTLALWGVLIFMAGVTIGGLTPLSTDSIGMHKLAKGFGVLAIIYGSVLLVGSLAGSSSMVRPLATLNTGGGASATEDHGLAFRRVKSSADLDVAIAEASSQGYSVMLDFYADWCVSCVEMEKYTFPDAGVQDALARTVLLQADVTANDEEDKALLQRFGVFGPPTIVFFGADGLQRDGYEVVGYMKANQFASHVRLAIVSN